MTDAVSAAATGVATTAQQGGGQATSGAGAGFDLVMALMAQLGGTPGEPDADASGDKTATPVAETAADPLLGAPTDAAAAVMAALLVQQPTAQTPIVIETDAKTAAIPTAAPIVAAEADLPVTESAPEQMVTPTEPETLTAPAPKTETEAKTAEVAQPAFAAPMAKADAKPTAEAPAKPSTTAPAPPATPSAPARARAAQPAERAALAETAEEAPIGEQTEAVAATPPRAEEDPAPIQVKASVQAAKTPKAEKSAPTAAPVVAAAPVDATEAQAPIETASQPAIEEAAPAASTSAATTVAQQAAVAAQTPRPAAPAQPAGESLRSRRLDNEGSELAQAPAGPDPAKVKSPVAGKEGAATAEKKPFAIDADKPSVAAQVEAAMTDAAEIVETQAETTTAASAGSTSSATSETARADAAAAVRGSPETVAQLSAQIAKKLENKVTRFDIALDPVDLGRVNVKLEIGRDGRVTAAMSFEKPQAAAELKARSGELRDALQQAGFELAQDALTFDLADQGGNSNPWAQQQAFSDDRQPAWNGRAFQAAMSGEDEPPLSNPALDWRASRASGVDVRI